MKRFSVALVAAVAILWAALLVDGQPAAQPEGEAAKPAPAKPAEPAGPVQAIKFDHGQHSSLDGKPPVVTDDNCSTCHGDDKKGDLAMPGRTGHKPCLDSGCHIDDFMNIGQKAKKDFPDRYRKAAAFCLGCHASAKGEPPTNFTKAKPDNVYQNNPTQSYHVEMDHFEHTRRTRCRDCHVVDKATKALILDKPGHAECAKCHGESEDAEPMGNCAECHSTPGPSAYFKGKWKGSEVRSCGSEGHIALAAKRKRKPEQIPCFKHETEKHRFRDSGEAIQCDQCHFMIGNKRQWKKNQTYSSVLDIKRNPLIHNEKDLAHKSCGGSSGCHRKDVYDPVGTAACKLCHSQRTIDSGLFEP